MAGIADWLTLIVAFAGVLSSAVIAYLAFSLSRQSARARAHEAIHESYDRLITFRTQHPEVLAHCAGWTRACFGALYSQQSADDRGWVAYYNYADLCIGFANAVLHARKARLLDGHAYEGQYKWLVKLILTENDPLIAILVGVDKYVSTYIKEFRRELADEGWNWAAMHRELMRPQEE